MANCLVPYSAPPPPNAQLVGLLALSFHLQDMMHGLWPCTLMCRLESSGLDILMATIPLLFRVGGLVRLLSGVAIKELIQETKFIESNTCSSRAPWSGVSSFYSAWIRLTEESWVFL
jgi:hypothetical protein